MPPSPHVHVAWSDTPLVPQLYQPVHVHMHVHVHVRLYQPPLHAAAHNGTTRIAVDMGRSNARRCRKAMAAVDQKHTHRFVFGDGWLASEIVGSAPPGIVTRDAGVIEVTTNEPFLFIAVLAWRSVSRTGGWAGGAWLEGWNGVAARWPVVVVAQNGHAANGQRVRQTLARRTRYGHNSQKHRCNA